MKTLNVKIKLLSTLCNQKEALLMLRTEKWPLKQPFSVKKKIMLNQLRKKILVRNPKCLITKLKKQNARNQREKEGRNKKDFLMSYPRHVSTHLNVFVELKKSNISLGSTGGWMILLPLLRLPFFFFFS